MKKLIPCVIVLAAALISTETYPRPIIVAVLDTGIDNKSVHHLCKMGHKSFIDNSPLTDEYGHGTHVAGLIAKYSDNIDYCMVSIKWHHGFLTSSDSDNLLKAIQFAINIHVDFINISAGGSGPNYEEKRLIEKALDQGIVVVAAAGNEDSNLDNNCNYFPACYDNRVITVGNLMPDGYYMQPSGEDKLYHNARGPASNYGNYVKRWEVGTYVLSNLPGGRHGYLTGTSQAAAIATGKLVHAKLMK